MRKKVDQPKAKSLFDHLNAIRVSKDPDYYNNLTEQEKKGFNQYVILMGLSMDKSLIDIISYLSKYLNMIPNHIFYKMCCDLIPVSKQFHRWVKRKSEKMNTDLLTLVAKHYNVGLSDAEQYCDIMLKSNNKNELEKLLAMYGKSVKEIKNLLK